METRSYVALLRGVNVAGRTVASNTLRLAVQALGHQDVTTYIQSGNVVFRTPRDDLERLADEIRLAVADVAGHRVTVILRTAQQLAAVVGSNPFAEACQARALYVTFLEEPPDRDRVQAISPGTALPDEFRPAGQEIFVHCPKGYGRSVLTNDFFERRLGVSATTRNWRTVTTLARMSAA